VEESNMEVIAIIVVLASASIVVSTTVEIYDLKAGAVVMCALLVAAFLL